MMISPWKNPLVSTVYTKIFQRCTGNPNKKYKTKTIKLIETSLAPERSPRQIPPVDPMLGYCWIDVGDVGLTLTQHWVNVSCFPGGKDRQTVAGAPVCVPAPPWQAAVPSRQIVMARRRLGVGPASVTLARHWGGVCSRTAVNPCLLHI